MLHLIACLYMTFKKGKIFNQQTLQVLFMKYLLYQKS